jgi:hypothetical protein
LKRKLFKDLENDNLIINNTTYEKISPPMEDFDPEFEL